MGNAGKIAKRRIKKAFIWNKGEKPLPDFCRYPSKVVDVRPHVGGC